MAVETFTIEEQIKYYREESREEGLEEGLEKARKEIILNMLQRNISINDICEMTGLTYEQVTAIKNKMNK
jgi:predicted transposase/invertase (TIGR01784 family)